MLKEFQDYISLNKMIEKDARILLAVSGGIDSMVMADLFIKSGYKTGIAHCNFSLRGKESDKDEELVRNFAQQNNLHFSFIKFDTKAFAKKENLSIQIAARNLRYRWFEQIRMENDYDVIAVAHNENDNIETLIINLVRGTGISGLTGMRPVNDRIIRPLLFAKRSEIEKYCKKNEIVYREDKSNAETKYIRNRIRHLVLPLLKKINPSLEKTLSETIVRLRETDELVEKYISGIRKDISVTDSISTEFDAELLHKYINEKSVLFELFRPFGLGGSQTEELKAVIKGKTGIQLYTQTHRILKNRNKVIVSSGERNPAKYYIIQNLEDLKKVPLIDSVQSIDISSGFNIPDDKLTACIDENEISYPIIIRKWEKGDYFFPLGMNNRKKISDFLIDLKKSLLDKEKIMVLESDGKIVWVIGERIDSRFKIKPSTVNALILTTLS